MTDASDGLIFRNQGGLVICRRQVSLRLAAGNRRGYPTSEHGFWINGRHWRSSARRMEALLLDNEDDRFAGVRGGRPAISIARRRVLLMQLQSELRRRTRPCIVGD
jgi:hypothetical protein